MVIISVLLLLLMSAYAYALVKNSLKRFQDPAMWARFEISFTYKRYYF